MYKLNRLKKDEDVWIKLTCFFFLKKWVLYSKKKIRKNVRNYEIDVNNSRQLIVTLSPYPILCNTFENTFCDVDPMVHRTYFGWWNY